MMLSDEKEQEILATVGVTTLLRVGQMLQDRVQTVCQEYGLTLSTANVLAIIDGAGEPLAPQVICDRLLVTSGAVTQLIDVLEKRELVTRIKNPEDRRSVLVQITEKGQMLRQACESALHVKDLMWLNPLEPSELTSLITMLKKVEQHIRHS
jgi:DNA-binding MarR family transcriptional regulator